MKKNFLITTGLIDTWEFSENNFLLGKWCEFYEFNDFDKKKFKREIPQEISIIQNTYHWDNIEKKLADYKNLKNIHENLLEIISSKLSIIHNINENKEYWRVIISNWLGQYITIIFDRWETIRIFFEKNNNVKFYSNFISLSDSDYPPPSNHEKFIRNSNNDEWNYLLYLRLLRFLNIQNLSLIKRKIVKGKLKTIHQTKDSLIDVNIIKLVDNIISKFAFRFNKIIFDTFYFPKKEFLKICLRCKLIPSIYSNFFNFNVKRNSLLKNDKRIRFKKLLLEINIQDKFIRFLLLNLHNDIPESYIEDFDMIRKKILPLAKKKKIIFSMHSMAVNDNFKIYIAETKKVGSKYIYSDHGGGLTVISDEGQKLDPLFNLNEKISYKIIRYDRTEKNKSIYFFLSPTLPIIRLKKKKRGDNCSIIFVETRKYPVKFTTGPNLDQSINLFDELTQFVNNLNPEIKSKIKFRTKSNLGYNTERRFAEIFGKENIDKVSTKNPLNKTISKSKLIIVTYPQTAFSQAMYSNIPTILIINKNQWQFSSGAEKTFNDLKNNKIAFDDFDGANSHINKYWDELDTWWRSENVQIARKGFLKNFFNVKSNWQTEWSDYVYSTSFFR